MSTLWQKILADLRHQKSRAVLAILSIAAGVFCVGTLYGMIDLQLSKMDDAHRQSQPSHINLILNRDAGRQILQEIAVIPNVNLADSLTPLSVSYRVNKQKNWQIGTLILRPEPGGQHFDRTVLVSGQWPQRNEIAIERLSALKTGLKIGDTVDFETAEGIQTLGVSAIVRHPFVKPPNFGGQIHFFASPEIAPVFAGSPDTFRQVLVQVTQPYDVEKARAVAQRIRDRLHKHGIGVLVSLLQNPDEHWGRPFFAGINDVLKTMALASLVLACILIFNTVAAHIAQQTHQIGIMKSLGASDWTIAKLYLIETGVIAFLAVLLALPLSCTAAYWSSCLLLDIFNIECGSFAYSPCALTLMAAGGLLAPLLSALPPIWRGATMNLRSAIASYGLGGDFGTSCFDRWLERISAKFLPAVYAAALGNLFRRKGQLLQTQIVLVIAGILFLVLMSLHASVNLTLDNEMARSRYSVRLGFSIDQDKARVVELAKSVAPTQQVELWQRFPVELLQNGKALKQKGSLGMQMLALPATTRLYRPYIESGRWFGSGDAGQRAIVMSAESAQLNQLKPGDWIKVVLGETRQDWQIIGLYRWLSGSNYAVEPIYAPRETINDMLRGYDKSAFALLSAPVETLKDEVGYLERLKQTFKQGGIKLDVFTTAAKLEQRQYAHNQMKPLLSMLFGLAALIAAVGGIGLSGTLAINVLQRIKEIGVLSAIGAPAKTIYRLFMLEGLLHALLAWLITIPLAYLAAPPIAERLGTTLFGVKLDFTFDRIAIVYWLIFILVLAFFSAFLPARRAAKLLVRDCLAH